MGKKNKLRSSNPNGTLWSSDKNKFGLKLLQKQGWEEGRGLGARMQGRTEHIKIEQRAEGQGLGVKKRDVWHVHTENFSSVLNTLNVKHSSSSASSEHPSTSKAVTSSTSVSRSTDQRSQGPLSRSSSAKERAPHAQVKMYKRRLMSKNARTYSSEDLKGIFGVTASEAVTKVEVVESVAENNSSEATTFKSVVSSISSADYFKAKLAERKRKREEDVTLPTQASAPDKAGSDNANDDDRKELKEAKRAKKERKRKKEKKKMRRRRQNCEPATEMSVQEFLKEGTKYLSGLEEAILRNVEASKQLSDITRTSMGPNGMNKLIVNKLEKLFVTSDTATIMRELDVIHPAAKMLVFAAQMQEKEIGDGTNLTVTLAGELLAKAESLLRMGMHPSDVVSGYSTAGKRVLEILEDIKGVQVEDIRDEAAVTDKIRTAVGSKLYGCEDVLAPVIAEACVSVCPKNAKNFNVDKIRVAKIMGGTLSDTRVVRGMVLVRDAESQVKSVTDAKVAVFAAGIDTPKTETKGTVLIHNAEQLLEFSHGDEKHMKDIVDAIVSSGAKVVVSGNTVGEMALHFLDREGIMVIKAPSKFDIRRICETTGATPLVRLGAPTPEELGTCHSVRIEQIGSKTVTIFQQSEEEHSQIATIVVRAATNNVLDDVERAVDDGVNIFKQMTRSARFVPGAGATEMEIARQLTKLSESTPGLDQYAIKRFAESFEVVPRTLAETAGLDVTEMVTTLYAEHEKDDGVSLGVDIENGGVIDAAKAGIWDLLSTKRNAIQLACDAAVTILRVDQLIMAKRAGGPKPPQMGARDS